MSDAVSKAQACDAAGKHNEAIAHLVAGAQQRDADAITLLGKRLLIGDRAPNLPRDGASLITEADTLGSGEAAAILAVLYALGTKPNHGLEDALSSLVSAAERGWQPAREQLLLLAEAPDESSAVSDWADVAGRIDLDVWRTAPPGEDLSQSPHIRSMPGFASNAVCGWLIEKAGSRLTRALVYEALSKKTTVSTTRTNTVANMNMLDADLVTVLVQNRIAASLNLSIRQLEPLAVLHYSEGEEITRKWFGKRVSASSRFCFT